METILKQMYPNSSFDAVQSGKDPALHIDINNISNASIAEDLSFYYFASLLRNIFIPIIVFVGVFGNTLSIVVFMSNYFVHVSSTSSSFLTGLACADNVFLLTLFVTWFDGSFKNFIVTVDACRVIAYVTYITSFLSVWFVVGFTLERYIAICHPLHVKIICSKSRERLSVLLLVLFALTIYNYALWTSSVTNTHGKIRCGLHTDYITLLEKLTWVDSILTMVVPFIMIAFLNLRVVRKSAKFHEKRKKCMKPSDALVVKKNTATYSKQQMRVTRTLLLVSTTFLVLNLPSHVVRIYNLIIYLTESQDSVGIGLYVVQEITQIIYYSTFGVNFFLYAFYGKHFRKSLAYLLKRALENCGNQKTTYGRTKAKSMTRITLERKNTFRTRLQSMESENM